MEREKKEEKIVKSESKLGGGPIAFLDLPDARSGKITRKLLKVTPDNATKGEKGSEYGHTAFRVNGCDISGALDKDKIFFGPQSRPSVPVELSEN